MQVWWVIGWMACARPSGASAPTCAISGESMALPTVQDGVLVQYQSTDREGELTGFRVFEDGRYERRRSGGPWEPRPSLSAADLGTIRDAVRAVKLPAGKTGAPAADDGGYSVLQIGRSSSLVIEQGCKVPEVDALFEVLGPRLP